MRGERVLIGMLGILGILGVVGGPILVSIGCADCVGYPQEHYWGMFAILIGILLLILASILALMRKKPGRKDRTLAIGAAVIAVVLVIGSSVLWIEKPWISSWEPEPHGQFSSAEQISATTISYRFGAFSPDASITNCKFVLHVNDSYVGTYPVTGSGNAHSFTVSNDSVSYTVTFYDDDNNGRLSDGDYVTFACSKSLTPMTDYTIFLIFALNGSVVCEETCST